MLKTTMLSTLAVCTLFLGACSSDDPAAEPPIIDPESGLSTLNWITCPDNGALDCATLSVPMNYSDDQAGDIEIALNRLPALQQPAQGVLMVNGGGPNPSLDVTETIAELEPFPDSVRERYDTISFDPRGFGLSTPVVCEVADESDLYLANEGLIDAFVLQRTEAAQQCHAEVGDYLLQLGSMNVVRDMESIREALGVEKLSFIALSYGTRLAALYLQNYPDRSDAFILDASENPDSSNRSAVRGLLPVYQQNLESLLMLCSITDPSCDAGALQQLLIDRTNLLVSEGELEELSMLLDLVIQATGDEDPEFGELLIAPLAGYLLRGETEDLLTLYQMLQADGQEEDEGDEEGVDPTMARRAVLCADDGVRPSTTDLQDYLQDFNAVSDFFAEYFLAEAAMCAGWPESPDPLPVIATSTAPKSLIIGGMFDATTPIVWSEEMANAIGGYFLASGHEGHTVVYQGGSDCVDDIATEFLIDGILPTAGDCL